MIIFGAFLFLISFLLVFTSSYFITSLITEKNSPLGLLYFPIINFAQIIISFEILSLFKAINIPCVLLVNIIFAVITYKIWKKNNKHLWYIEKNIIKHFFFKIKNSFKLDKTLIILGLFYLVFISSALFLAVIMPVTSGDGKIYHAARSFFYVYQGSLNHFTINDIRALCMPINSEILYTWIILFFKKDVFLACFSFIGYVLTIIATFNLMHFLKFSYRRRLWVIFILSSLASVIVQVSSTETDIIITALVLSSIYFFWTSLKTNKKIPLYMAALSYAIAIGTKTPSILMIPAVGLFMLVISSYYKNYKYLGLFIIYGIINFFIFSSYNYILNFIDYKNIAGPEYFMIVSKNYDGIKGACANFIKYIFMFFDFTGFKWSDLIRDNLLNIKANTLSFLGLSNMKDGIYTVDKYFQRSLIEQLMGGGVLGFLVILPCWIISLFKGFSKNKTQKLLFLYAIVLLVNLITISYFISYMAYSVRFLMEFIVISSPIIAISYFSNKNPLKYIIIYFSMTYLVLVSTHIWIRPFVKISKFIIKQKPSIQEIREIPVCRTFYTSDIDKIDCKIRYNIIKYKKNTKILLIPVSGMNYVGFGKLKLEGYKIDIAEPELLSFENKNLDEYDIIISPATFYYSTIIKEYDKRKNDCTKVYEPKDKMIIECKEKRAYSCFYKYNYKISETDKHGNLRMPFAVICNLNKYILSKNFKISRIVGINFGDYKESEYYIFYQNKNRKENLK